MYLNSYYHISIIIEFIIFLVCSFNMCLLACVGKSTPLQLLHSFLSLIHKHDMTSLLLFYSVCDSFTHVCSARDGFHENR